ncbi:hypothetical protein BU24DRAFT_484675 [Aaosphaeria arxii CBS 175.79]|uniref:DUF1446-domain-containing protein n=1 Tax=Aaosphaeria arxii CBS 175.79 TaxID=1450172 RepID=A0A6A5XJ48_9PLEO|nr:uncharacterized protein BU24DRAFT_484675 [Aaosphaeria arxii CBS 175.79]KAF2012861.1 hypothetical protein BU24DRAFT_484675 [Aaosphaeria arxii CBS 175.79]
MGEFTISSQFQDELVPVCHIVTPVGMLGYGFNEQQTRSDVQRYSSTNVPTAIILDSGSTDSGPDKLALGTMTCPRSSYARDLTKLLRLVNEFKVPLIFSSAGGDGSDEHVREMVQVIEEICDKPGNEQYRFKVISIYSELEKSLVFDSLQAGAITGCGTVVPALQKEDIESVPRIVSQMGLEPFLDAMNANPDFNIIVGGRAYDPSPYVAYAAFASKTRPSATTTLASQKLWGGFTHMGKIMECGGACAKPKSSGASATVYADGTFDISPSDPNARCTSTSVAAHGLYEKSRPDILSGPGGYLDLKATTFEELPDGRTLRVRGALFTFSRDVGTKYQIKLEAASVIGYRAMYMGSMKDPILIGQLDSFLSRIKAYVKMQHEDVDGSWELDFHTYGRDQVSSVKDKLGELSEIFLVGEALADSQDLAASVVSTARIATIHGSYLDQKATSGNLAFGIGGKTCIELGPCSKFSIYHLMDIEEGEERLRKEAVGKGLFQASTKTVGIGKIVPADVSSSNGVAIQQVTVKARASSPAKGESTSKISRHKTPTTLDDLASVLRSKNSGPYEITFDILFDDKERFELVKRSNLLNDTVISRVLATEEKNIIWSGFFDQALAYKVTIPRTRKGKVEPNGGYMENDVHGSQKYLGLLNMKLPEDLSLSLGGPR